MNSNVETRHLRYFIAVAEELHFRRAAERLNLSQPSLSRAVRQLELAVGVQLLDRSSRRVELTAAGQICLENAYRVQEVIENTVALTQKAAAGEAGHFTIGYTDFAISGVLPQVLEGFRRLYPAATIDLLHMFTAPQIDALKQESIDFGFMTGPVRAESLTHMVVQNDRFVVVLPEAHPLARMEIVPLEALAEERFVVGMAQWWSHYIKHLESLCHGAGFSPKIVQEAFNSEGIFGLVAANMGITIHPECARNYIRKGLVIRKLKNVTSRVPTEAAWLADAETPLKMRFIEFLTDWTKNAGAK